MRVHHLTVLNFRILGGSAIDFAFPAGRIGIFGPNEVGKSSVLDAIEVALFGVGSGRKAAGAERAELVTWGRDSTDLALEFSSGLERYRIHRRVGRRHEADLYQLVDGEERLMSSSVQEIQDTVPSIVGMDREAFEKLVYVRQKDLDALREVAKASREAMMNKVMGMEVFDEAIGAAKTDLRAREADRDMSGSDLTGAEQDWRLHLEREIEQKKERLRFAQITSKMAEAQKQEAAVQTIVECFEWLKEENNLRDLHAQVKEQVTEVSAQHQELQTKSKQMGEAKAVLADLGHPEKIEASLRRRAHAVSLCRKREQDARVAQEKLDRAEQEVATLRKHDALARKVTQLLELQDNLHGTHSGVLREKSQLHALEIEIAAEELKAGVKATEAQMVRAGLSANKKRLLALFGGTLLAGVIALVLGFLFLLPILVVGIGLLAAAGWAFARFLRLERLAERAVGLVARAEQRKSLQQALAAAERAFAAQLLEARIASLNDLENETKALLWNFKKATGIDRPEAFADALRQREQERVSKTQEFNRLRTEAEELKTAAREEDAVYPVPFEGDLDPLLEQIQGKVLEKQNLEGEIKAIERSVRAATAKNLPSKLDSIRTRLNQIESDIEKHAGRRPADVDGRVYSEQGHQQAIANLRTVQGEVKEMTGQHRAIEEGLRRIDEDLERTRHGFERYPALKERFGQLSEEVRVLDRVADEIRATGGELRAKVLPAARYILNQLLPVITDGRYTDLEISEDFQFQAFSPEAGGFKKRDVFSGGTQDQFLIALRLAFTQAILDSRVRADEYSLFLDECTASSDDVRKQGIFQVLDSMKATFSQIFIVAHEDISSFVDHHLALERGVDGYTVVRARSWAD